MAQRQQEVIERLERDGLLHRNRQRPLALVPQRVAVISSETAAGYHDFLTRLSDNWHGYVFYPVLFPATMQGDSAEWSAPVV